jgi:RND superfamily putative drug exporter
MLERLGRAAARRHWRVLIAWVVVAVIILGLAGKFGGKTNDNFTIPGTESSQALSLLEANAPSLADAAVSVVFQAPSGQTLTTPANQAAITTTLANLKALPHVTSITDPFTSILPPTVSPTTNIPNTDIPVSRVFPPSVSSDNTVALASAQYDTDTTLLPPDTLAAAQAAVAPAEKAGLAVSFGGGLVDLQNQPPPGISEFADEIGLVCAAIILLIALGSVTAMVVPIGVALFGVGVSGALLALAERWISIGSAAAPVGVMIGLGVGIDYSLFILNRYRQNLGEGMDTETAIARSVSTSGSAVLFAAITVCVALSGLALIGIPYVATLGFSAALFVVVTVIAALTALPALLGLIGPKIESLRLPWHKPAAEETPEVLARSLSSRWAHEVARRPVLFTVISLSFLVLMTIPVKHMELGIPDDSTQPIGLTQRTAFDVISSTPGFGPGRNGPLLVVVDLGTDWASINTNCGAATPAGAAPAAAPTLTPAQQGDVTALLGLGKAMLDTPGVQSVSYLPCTGQVAVLPVIPTSGPSDPATSELVNTLRSTTIPKALSGTAVSSSSVLVGGSTAVLIDLTDTISAKMPLFIGAVLFIAFLLLMMVFRSLFVPFKAVVMNLLSIGASLGFLVCVFQWGWAKELFGVDQTLPIVAFIPVMMFAILFGLSMDYEVFLLSRIREAYLESGDGHDSVVVGLGSTARVITAAALIMISVFVTFSLNPSVVVKMLALGMAVAVFIDATIVRMVAVPATMELMGKGNWWLPHWLDRMLPHINVDAPNPPPATDSAPDDDDDDDYVEPSGPSADADVVVVGD